MLKKFKAPLTLLIAGVLLLPGLVLAVGAKVDSSKADYLFTQQILFVDIRSSSDWDAGRVAGAEHLDVNKMSEEGLADLVEKDEVFIVYGNDSGDKRVSDAVSKAASWGFAKIHFYPDGFVDWKKRGKPVE